MLILKWIFKQLNTVQKSFCVFSSLFFCFSIAFIIKLQVRLYFFDRFDFDILKELTAGNYVNLLSYINWKFFIFLFIIPVPFVLIVFLVKFLKVLSNQKRPDSGKLTVHISFLVIGILISATHFMVSPYESLRYGLNEKFSYWIIDRSLMTIADFDHDGFSSLSYPKDTNDFNSAVFPYAVEIIDNNIDENGLAGDLKSLDQVDKEESLRQIDKTNGKNVIVMVIETFRTDLVGKMLNGKEVTPFLNTLKKEYDFSTHVFSNFGVTARAIQSIFLGSLSYNLGDDELFSYFKRFGYTTIGISAQNETWGNTDKYLQTDNFDCFYDSRSKNWNKNNLTPWQKAHIDQLSIDSKELNSTIFSVMEKNTQSPFFMYINYQDLHYPYYHDGMDLVFIDEFRDDPIFFKKNNVANIYRQYANAAYHLDHSIKMIFEKLKDLNILKNTVIIIVGDHPDSFYENGILGHAWAVDESQRRTPLFVVNGKGRYSFPIGQNEIAEMIINSVDPDLSTDQFEVFFDDHKKIFLMTAQLEKPRQIAWISDKYLFSYDFKTENVVSSTDSTVETVKVSDLYSDTKLFKTYKRLVNRWESVLILKSNKIRSH